ncbi:MAG: SAM-dependent methyltransferase [Treponema sp. CETP13]|nr:MAG: SAM-dependent methyltransferase [Treponema sp. CETP13]
MNILPRVFLNKNEENEIRQGFPWVFDNEISFVKENELDKEDKGHYVPQQLKECKVKDGSPVEVLSKGGLFLGYGIINRNSKIAVRIMRRDKLNNPDGDDSAVNPFPYSFFEQKIKDAYSIRYDYYNQNDSYRLIFGEADFLPGLIAERYVDIKNQVILVVQFLAYCVEAYREEILSALKNVCSPFAIYERSDANVREKEGLEQRSGCVFGKVDDIIIIKENGVQIEVDLAHGQKTGYFLDQKFNRARVAQLSKGCRVLDTCTHTGAFGLNAVKGGAKEVIAVDISSDAVALVKRNIALNNAQNEMRAIEGDVFDVLKDFEMQKEKFDLIILDPPAFAKSAKAVSKAYGGYKEINLRALRLLNRGGILVTCSCSHFFDSDKFYDMLMHAAMDSKCTVQVLEKRGAGPDHPVLLGYPKSEYLKCAICKVL